MNAELSYGTRPRTRLLAPLPALLALTLPAHPATAQEVGQRFRECPTCPVMVVVPAGSFGDHVLRPLVPQRLIGLGRRTHQASRRRSPWESVR